MILYFSIKIINVNVINKMGEKDMNEIIGKKVFGWRETGTYTTLDLGTMLNAIVIKVIATYLVAI
jgi:hypothetical protein